MAPLSVHRPGRGTRMRMPRAEARSTASTRRREFAATPPPIRMSSMPSATARVDRLAGQHVTHRLLEGRRDVGDRHRVTGGLAGLHPPGDRGLQPGEGEVEAMAFEIASRRQAPREVDGDRRAGDRGVVDVAGRRGTAGRAAGPPCRRPRPLRRRWSSQRLDGVGHVPDPEQGECPPETSSARQGSGRARARAGRLPHGRRGGSRRTAASPARVRATSQRPRRPAAHPRARDRRSRRSRRRHSARCPRSRRRAGWWAPSPRGGPATRPRVRRPRTARVPRPRTRPHRRAGCARARCRRRSRRTTSRCRGREGEEVTAPLCMRPRSSAQVRREVACRS